VQLYICIYIIYDNLSLLRDECFQVPDIYKPVDFVTNVRYFYLLMLQFIIQPVFYYNIKVLQHSSVKLTWDDDDPDRVKNIRKKFTRKDIDDVEFKAYIASSSEESDEDVEETRQKYKNLLNEIENDNAEESQEMEITFTPGLSEAAALNSEKV
jgi:hypothetical protein